jgi:hypothetical protein
MNCFSITCKGFIFLFFIVCEIHAQNLGNSIYGFQGSGDHMDFGTPEQEQAGNIHGAYRSSFSPNFHNPASLSYLSLTNYNVGVRGVYEEQRYKTGYVPSYNAYASNASLAFPVNKIGGACLGFRPFSTGGVEGTASDIPVGNQPANYRFLGNGGVSRFFGGLGIAPFATSRDSFWQSFSIGYYASYLFGQIRRSESLLFSGTDTSGYFHSAIVQSANYRGVLHQLGWQQSFRLNRRIHLDAGFSYQLPSFLSSLRESYSITNNANSQQLVTADTLNFRDAVSGSWSGGLGIGLGEKWKIWLDYGSRGKGSAQYALASQRYAVGLLLWPGPEGRGGIFSRSQYRLGATYTANEAIIGTSVVSSFSVRGGIGLSARKLRPPMFFLGFEYRRRGGSGLVNQTFYGVNIGISINEKWFIRRRID